MCLIKSIYRLGLGGLRLLARKIGDDVADIRRDQDAEHRGHDRDGRDSRSDGRDGRDPRSDGRDGEILRFAVRQPDLILASWRSP